METMAKFSPKTGTFSLLCFKVGHEVLTKYFKLTQNDLIFKCGPFTPLIIMFIKLELRMKIELLLCGAPLLASFKPSCMFLGHIFLERKINGDISPMIVGFCMGPYCKKTVLFL